MSSVRCSFVVVRPRSWVFVRPGCYAAGVLRGPGATRAGCYAAGVLRGPGATYAAGCYADPAPSVSLRACEHSVRLCNTIYGMM